MITLALLAIVGWVALFAVAKMTGNGWVCFVFFLYTALVLGKLDPPWFVQSIVGFVTALLVFYAWDDSAVTAELEVEDAERRAKLVQEVADELERRRAEDGFDEAPVPLGGHRPDDPGCDCVVYGGRQ